jgi:hypothetical protein
METNPMTRVATICVLSVAFVLAPFAALRAESVVDHLPDDALGMVVIRDLAGFNAKVEKLTKIFQDVAPAPIPAPLPLAKAATGLGDGLNEQGDAMLALLMGDDGPTSPMPLLLAPVSDYAAFAESVKGDATGDICRVTIAGEEVLVAQRGAFAVIMNVENRDRLESLVAAEPQAPAALAPLAKWLATTDVAAVLTPLGRKTLTELGKASIDAQQNQLNDQFGDPEMADTLKQMQQSMAMVEAMLGFIGAEVDAVGVGLAIDDSSNVKVSKRVLLAKEGELANVKSIAPLDPAPLAGYPAASFVIAAGGPFPPEWGEAMSRTSRKLMEQFPGIYGLDDLPEEQWKKMEQVWRTSMQGLRSMSMVLETGDEDDPLYSNFFGVIKIDNAKQYLKNYREAIKMWNDIMVGANAKINMQYEVSDVQVDGHDGLLMVLDVANAAGGDNAAMMAPMMEVMFGEGGKMRMYMVAANDDTVVMGIGDEERVAKFISRINSGKGEFFKAASVQTTVKLLDSQAPWQGYLSPQGCVTWFSRMISKMMGQFGGGGPTIPEYPETPPVGFALNIADGQFAAELVVPVEALQGLADYIKKFQ